MPENRFQNFRGFGLTTPSELTKKLKKSWSFRTHKSLKQSLLRLSVTTFVWSNSYCDGISKKYFRELRAFTILTDLHIAEVGEEQSHPNKQACRIRFNLYLDSNLRSKHTQPTFYNQIIKFKSGIAQLIYQHLELVMHDKTKYERTSYNLFFEDLQLECVDYKYPSGRKKALDIAVKELQSVVIPSGIINVTVELTKDERDYKIVVIKEERTLLSLKYEEAEEKAESSHGAKTVTKTTQKDSKPTTLAEQIVVFFLEKFRIKRKDPLKKELSTAQEWIEEYKLDLEKAQIFIGKCKVWAAETDFDVQNFAGLRQYLDRTTQIFEQIEVERAIRVCGLCDSNGHIDGTEANGREFSFKCVHDLEKIQSYSNKYKVQVRLYDKSTLEPK